jgi:hypothetical protein
MAAATPAMCRLSAPCSSASPRALLSRPAPGGFRWRPRRRTRRVGRATGRVLVVVGEFGGTYEDGFEDVNKVRFELKHVCLAGSSPKTSKLSHNVLACAEHHQLLHLQGHAHSPLPAVRDEPAVLHLALQVSCPLDFIRSN